MQTLRPAVIDYGKHSRRRRRNSEFLSQWLPTFGVLLAIPALLASFVAIGATIEAGTKPIPLTYDGTAAFGICAVVLAICVCLTIVAFGWICESREPDESASA